MIVEAPLLSSPLRLSFAVFAFALERHRNYFSLCFCFAFFLIPPNSESAPPIGRLHCHDYHHRGVMTKPTLALFPFPSISAPSFFSALSLLHTLFVFKHELNNGGGGGLFPQPKFSVCTSPAAPKIEPGLSAILAISVMQYMHMGAYWHSVLSICSLAQHWTELDILLIASPL